ncbi:MAG: SLBB domain-containing protein [candidate division WOR-3 bacterium]
MEMMCWGLVFMFLNTLDSTQTYSIIEHLSKPIVAEDYILMPGDTLLVTVSGTVPYSYKTGITYEGKIMINIPVTQTPTPQGMYVLQHEVVEVVPVIGLSLKLVRDSLEKVFMRYYRNVHIDVTLIGMRVFYVYVAGEVKFPGSILATPVDRISEVIKRAGGTTPLGTRTKIQLKRQNKLIQIVNLENFERYGNTENNPFVQDGDVIYVPKMEKSVIVKGAVFGKMGYELKVSQLTAAMERTSEGLYELNDGEKVSDLISKAGGLTPWADLKNCYVLRGEKKIGINLHEILTHEESEANIYLEDGDVIVVPTLNTVVYVQGQVVNPGAFPFQPNLKASDYIGLAGGPLSDASMSSAYLIRKGKKISLKKDPVILEGDRIVVPRQIFKFWQDYVEIGSVVASLLLNYLTFRALAK